LNETLVGLKKEISIAIFINLQ